MGEKRKNIIYIKSEYEYFGFVKSMVETLGKENEVIFYLSNVDLAKGTLNALVISW